MSCLDTIHVVAPGEADAHTCSDGPCSCRPTYESTFELLGGGKLRRLPGSAQFVMHNSLVEANA